MSGAVSDPGPAVVHALPGLSLADTVPDGNTIWTFRFPRGTDASVRRWQPAITVLFKRFKAALAFPSPFPHTMSLAVGLILLGFSNPWSADTVDARYAASASCPT
jgi:hypothetical protein